MTKTQTVRRLVAADGAIINHGVNDHMVANGYADRYPGATYVVEQVEVPVAPYEAVLIESGIDERYWPLLRADMGRMLNMARDAGRPSDAMRSSVRAFRAGTLTEESFAASRPSGYYPDDAQVAS